MHAMQTAEEAAEERFKSLQQFIGGRGLVWYQDNMSLTQIQTFGARSAREVVGVLLFIKSQLPKSDELEAAFNALNLQFDPERDEMERRHAFFSKQHSHRWTDREYHEQIRLERDGIRILATIYDVMRRYSDSIDDGR